MRRYRSDADDDSMEIAQWWPKLSGAAQDWLIEHNGEPLPMEMITEIDAVSDNCWSAATNDDGLRVLPDESVDWIEAWANGETPGE